MNEDEDKVKVLEFVLFCVEMYAQSGQAGQQAGPGAGQQPNNDGKEDVQDADFEEVK